MSRKFVKEKLYCKLYYSAATMSRKVSNADAATAINSILHFPGTDQEALLEVIGDYFYEGRGDTEEDV